MARRSASDSELVEAWNGGDASAGDTLIERYYTGVFRFFESRVPRAAEDLTQRTLMQCVEGRGRFEGRGTFRSFLYAIAWRQLMRYWRSTTSSSVTTSFDEGEADPAPGPSPTTLMRQRKEHQLLHCALQALPIELQAAVGLSYWEGLTAAEIAGVFGTSASAMRSRLARARELLRRELASVSTTSTARASVLSDLDRWTHSAARDVELGAPTVGELLAKLHGS